MNGDKGNVPFKWKDWGNNEKAQLVYPVMWNDHNTVIFGLDG
jgi:hypothetical protein